MSEFKNLNIYEKLSAITAELGTVSKNLTVATGNNGSYKAVSERDILDAIKPLENKYGIYSYPCDREVLESNILERTTKYGTSTSLMTRIKTVYKFVNVDNAEEIITTVVFAEGIDSQDKGSGKAMTYADKYALMKAYKISTGDDTDKEASEDGKITQSKPMLKTTKDLLKEELEKRGIDKNVFLRSKGLTVNSTESDFGKALAELHLLKNDEGVF